MLGPKVEENDLANMLYVEKELTIGPITLLFSIFCVVEALCCSGNKPPFRKQRDKMLREEEWESPVETPIALSLKRASSS